MCRPPRSSLVLFTLGLLLARPVAAGAQLQISEVLSGTAANVYIQYVQLRVAVAQADLASLAQLTLIHRDNGDTERGRVSLGLLKISNLSRGATILIATSAAATSLALVPDLIASFQINPIGGSFCLQDPAGNLVECLVYGPYHGVLFASAIPSFNSAGGIPRGLVAQRFQSTGASSTDFWFAPAALPQNNAGQVGRFSGTCGNGLVEGLEQCDGITQAGALCSNQCRILINQLGNFCSNHQVDDGEECDDGNTFNLDGCSSLCRWENPLGAPAPVCGNGILEITEQCDDGNRTAGDGCDPNCFYECNASCQAGGGPRSVCGNHILEAGEACEIGTSLSGATCSNQCLTIPTVQNTTSCGNRIVEPGESCDHGTSNGSNGDTCSARCLFTIGDYFVCGNGVVEPGEACDLGTANGTPGTLCSSTCTQLPPVVCGDGIVEAPEQCDNGILNGAAGNPCSAHCTLIVQTPVVASAPVQVLPKNASCQALGGTAPSLWAVLWGFRWVRRRRSSPPVAEKT